MMKQGGGVMPLPCFDTEHRVVIGSRDIFGKWKPTFTNRQKGLSKGLSNRLKGLR